MTKKEKLEQALDAFEQSVISFNSYAIYETRKARNKARKAVLALLEDDSDD